MLLCIIFKNIDAGNQVMFMFKKIVSAMLLPIPIALFLLFAGLFLLWLGRSKKTGKRLITLSGLLIIFVSFTPTADLITKPLENAFEPFDTQSSEVQYIVVLGNGHVTDLRLPATSHINTTSLARLVEGIRIYHANKDAKLVFSGWGDIDVVSNAHAVANVAVALGIPSENIMIEPEPRDTLEEALKLKTIIGDEQFALVTSATHMYRAMAIFSHQGLSPIAAPANYYIKSRANRSQEFKFNALNIKKTEVAIHEYLGILWLKLRKEI